MFVLTRVRTRGVASLVSVLIAGIGLVAQSAGTAPGIAPGGAQAGGSFTTVSITAASSGAPAGGLRLLPRGGLQARSATLVDLIAFAYQRHAFDQRLVVGGPAWAAADRFDLQATAATEHVMDPSGVPAATLRRLQTLLAERFGVAVHEEDRIQPIYALTLARADGALGPRLRRSEIDCSALSASGPPPKRAPGLGPVCATKTPPGRLFADTLPMAALATLISKHVDRPVVDRTGLPGPFDMELEAAEIKAPPNYQPGPSDLALPPAAGPSIFVAVREQLGLELKPVEGAVSVIVMDRAQRPTP
jgi:uncharacterized protein (TIGR03435 family)